MRFLTTLSYWDAVVRISVPLALAAVGALLSSRAGVLHIAVEGVMLIGAFFSVAGAIWTESVWGGVLLGTIAGAVASVLFGLLSMKTGMGDVVAGLVVHIGALGLTGFLVREWFPTGAFLTTDRLKPLWDPPTGTALDLVLHQHPLVYGAVLAALAVHMFLGTRSGLRIRASGESVAVAEALGIRLVRLRLAVLAVSGALIAAGGAVLGLAVLGAFSVNMVNGRGFIALACVMLGRWRPLGAIAAAIFFGAADAYQFQSGFEAAGRLAQLVPYVAVLVALAVLAGRSHAPHEEGRGLPSHG